MTTYQSAPRNDIDEPSVAHFELPVLQQINKDQSSSSWNLDDISTGSTSLPAPINAIASRQDNESSCIHLRQNDDNDDHSSLLIAAKQYSNLESTTIPSDDESCIGPAGIPLKLRHQAVVYVNGPGLPERARRPEAQHVMEAESEIAIAAHIALDGDIEEQVRMRIMCEAVQADVVCEDEHDLAVPTRTGFKKGYRYCFATLVVTAAIVGTIIVSRQLTWRTSAASPSSLGPTETPVVKEDVTQAGSQPPIVPTSAPTIAPATAKFVERMQGLQNLLYPLSGSLLLDPTSSQHQAFQWLLNNDTLALYAGVNNTDIMIQERYLLMLLYFATSGPEWLNQHKFSTGSQHCQWTLDNGDNGISCNEAGHVTWIILSSNNLIGSLPAELGYLDALVHICLNTNMITGSLPSTFGRVTSLQQLDLGFNLMNGTLPTEIFELKDLQILGMDNNKITGTIPWNIGNCESLSLLSFYHNELQGSIPESISRLTLLKDIYLGSNWLTGPVPTFQHFEQLRTIEIFDNVLNGTLPSTLGMLSKLTSIISFGNALSGTIPTDITSLPHLVFLDLGRNNLTGSLPYFRNTSSVEAINLAFNQLTGRLDDFFDEELASQLMYVDLGYNSLSGTITSQIGLNTQLTQLALLFNHLTGTIPTSIGLLTELNYQLYLGGNSLQGLLPSEIGMLSKLLDLSVNNNTLSGSLPSALGAMSKLIVLNLDNNLFTGSVPSSIAVLLDLEYLFVSGNNGINNGMETICEQQLNIIDQVHANCLFGKVNCSCCTTCCGDPLAGGNLTCQIVG